MKSKSQIVLDAEWTYQDLNLKCLDVIKELKKFKRLTMMANQEITQFQKRFYMSFVMTGMEKQEQWKF